MLVLRIKKTIASLVILFAVLRIETHSSILLKEEIKSFRSRRSTPAKTCFEMISQCRENASCLTTYRTVKRKCSFSRNVCRASPNFLPRCVREIRSLKEFAFKEKCDCFIPNIIGVENKLKKCLDIYNLIFVNPCYDHGEMALEEERLSAATTMKAFVAMETSGVTEGSSSSSSHDLSDKLENHVTPATRENDLGNDVLGQTSSKGRNSMSESNSKNLRPPKQFFELTEAELQRLDELFAIDNERPSNLKPPIVETPNFHSNDVSNAVSNNGKFRSEASGEGKNLSFANANRRPSTSHKAQPVTQLANKYLDGVNYDVKESEEYAVTDANTSELEQVIAKVMEDSYETDVDDDHYVKTHETKEKLTESDQSMYFQSPSHMNEDKISPQPNTIQIAFIVLGSAALLLAVLGAIVYFKRARRSDYVRGKFLKKSCQSAIIVKPIYEDKDRNVKRKINHI